MLASRNLCTLTALTAAVLSRTWEDAVSNKMLTPSLRSAWEFLIHQLVQAVPERCTALAHPASCTKHFVMCNCEENHLLSFSSGVQCQLHFMPPVTGVEGNEHGILCLPSPWSPSFYRWYSGLRLCSRLISVFLLCATMGKWFLIPSGWTRWTLVFCSTSPKPARKIPSVLKFYQWMCFHEGWSSEMWKKVLSAAKTQLCAFSPKIPLL